MGSAERAAGEANERVEVAACTHAHHASLRSNILQTRNVRPSEVFGEHSIAGDCICGSTIEVPATLEVIRANLRIHTGNARMVQAWRKQLASFLRPVEMVVLGEDCNVYVDAHDDVELVESKEALGTFESLIDIARRLGLTRQELWEMFDAIALELTDRRTP